MGKLSNEQYLNILLERDLLDSDEDSKSENIIQETVDEVRDEFKNNLKKHLKEISLRILGFENRWNKWEVDSCNGRRSEISEMLSEEVKEYFKSTIKEDVILSDKETTELKKVYKDKFIQEYKSYIMMNARDEAKRIAKQHLNELVAETMKDHIDEFKREITEQVLGIKNET